MPSLPRLSPVRPSPPLTFCIGSLSLVAVGTVLLALPIAAQPGRHTTFLDALFTATSAASVTGLSTLDTPTHWGPFGQAVIVLLIQLGGFGYMTVTTALVLLAGRRMTLADEALLAQSVGASGAGQARALAVRVAIFTFLAEAGGTLFLAPRLLVDMPPAEAISLAIFWSVSAFNNSGFHGLAHYHGDPLVLLPIATLVVLGGLSYVAVEDLASRRQHARLTLDTRLSLWGTGLLLVLGTLGLLIFEWRNPATFGALAPGTAVLNAFFHSVSVRTAGFAAIDIGALSEASLFLLILLMLVGGAAGSTAGGLKIQTVALLGAATVAALRGRQDVELFGRRARPADLLRAVAVTVLSAAVVILTAFGLSLSDPFGFQQDLFEAVSAFCTVGLTTGITPQLSPSGRVTLIIAMLIGRIGPVTLLLALLARERPSTVRWPEEAVRVG
ncbi:MAG: potassium transporter TrkG [Chloroflexota bacterium]